MKWEYLNPQILPNTVKVESTTTETMRDTITELIIETMTDIIIEVDIIETILDMIHRSLLIADIIRVKGLMRKNRAI